jgi:hypothetical protein
MRLMRRKYNKKYERDRIITDKRLITTVPQPAVCVISTVLIFNPFGHCNGVCEIHPV